jgi:geranylgeranyl diphosphate synthase type II
MKLEDKLIQGKEKIDCELERILPQGNSLLFQAMKYSVLSGGKRFRPLLLLFSGECFGVDWDTALPFACALELIHNYSLIHDDLPSMDNDDFRRGKPTCHKAFGESIALLAGDGLLTLAFRVAASAPMAQNSPLKKVKIIEEMSRSAGVNGMIGGQLLDISVSSEEMTEKILKELIQKKTGALITAAVKIGALLGEADSSQMNAIIEYGENIGLAFQTRDDIMDAKEDAQGEIQIRPNSVSFFGVKKTEERLKKFIDNGIFALDKASLDSKELRFMAHKLLTVSDG